MQPIRGDDYQIDQGEGGRRKAHRRKSLSLIARIAPGGKQAKYVLQGENVD